MSLGGKVLIGFILVASLGFVYLAGRTVYTHSRWGMLATARKNAIDQKTAEQTSLTEQQKETQDQIHRVLIGWERVWDNLVVTGIDPQNGAVTLTGDAQQLAGLQPDRVAGAGEGAAPEPRMVHAFVFPESPGQYLGEFRVASVQIDATANTATAVLEPAVRIALDRLQQFQGQGTPWQLRSLIPDGLKARLRDRATDLSLMQDEANRRATMATTWEETAREAERHRELRVETVAGLERELADTEAARDQALAENTRLTQDLAGVVARRNELIEQNKQLAAEIGRLESQLIGGPARTASARLP